MTHGAREEIERVAREISNGIWYELSPDKSVGVKERMVTEKKIKEAILAQVEKARREAIEECEQLVIDKNYGKKSDFSESIRNKLNQKGE